MSAGEGGAIDEGKQFDFTVKVTVDGAPLTGTYSGLTFTDGQATFQLKHGERKTIEGLPNGASYKVTEAAAAGYTTTSENAEGTISTDAAAEAKFVNTYGSLVPEGGGVALNSQIKKVFEGRTWNEGDEFTFQITSANGGPLPDGVTSEDGTTGTVTVKGNGTDTEQMIHFGSIPFTFDDIKDVEPGDDGKRMKEFTYTVTELAPEGVTNNEKDGITYDTHTATITVVLTDNGDGTMSGETSKVEGNSVQNDVQLMAFVQSVEANTFTNVYKSELDYGVAGGLTITKMLDGRDMTDGQFQFEVKQTQGDDDRLGLVGTHGSHAADNGVASVVATAKAGVKFTNEDAGKTWKYTVSEVADDHDGKGYAYDKTTYTVTVAVADNGDSTLTVTTTVSGGKDGDKTYTYTTGQEPAATAVVDFNNSYTAGPEYLGGEGKVSLEATKTLTGRDMTAGEFGFTVFNGKEEVATGSNAAAEDGQAGKITFSAIEYTSDKLYDDAKAGKATASAPDADGKITYTYDYTVKETRGAVDGVTATKGEFTVTVKVTDNNDGTLNVAVEPVEGGMAFTNAYGEGKGGTSTISASGRKSYEYADGLNAPDIAGKYTFTFTGSEGAPMPEKTETTNDASGNVNFGTITYTMQNVFGDSGQKADAETGETTASEQTDLLASDEASVDEGVAPAKSEARTKTFTYTVKESGNVAGVSTDSDKTFTVTVTDDGMGHLAAKSSAGEGSFLFDFTNTYSVQPLSYDVTAALNATKTLTGRAMTAGEFAFQVVEVIDGQDVVVSKGTNGAAENGQAASVMFDAITYTEPGVHTYKVSEVDGEAGGVAYDSSSYVVTVTVKDNGDGTLSAETVVKDDAKLAFANEYVAAPTDLQFNGLKKLDGRELMEGEFTFELREDGKVVQTVTNGDDGAVTFSPVTFNEVGEHHYEIAEVKGDVEGMTYDDTVYTYDVVVTDNGEGRLAATWTAGENGSAVIFCNSYVAPAEPVEPAPAPEPPAPEVPETGDSTNAALPVAIALAGTAVVSAAWVTSRRRKN